MQILLIGIPTAIGVLGIFCLGLYIGYRTRQQNEPELLVPEGFRIVTKDQINYEQDGVNRTVSAETGEVKTIRNYALKREESGPVTPKSAYQLEQDEQREAEQKRVKELVQ